MAELVDAMKLARQYSGTVLAGEYSRGMLQVAHTLAVDAKNLYDTVESARNVLKENASASERSATFVGDLKRASDAKSAVSDEHSKLVPNTSLLRSKKGENKLNGNETDDVVQASRSSGEMSSGISDETSGGRISKLSSGVSSGLSSGVSDGGISSGFSDAGISMLPCNSLIHRTSGLSGTLLLNSDSDEDSDENGVPNNADVDLLSSEADRCLEAETDENVSDEEGETVRQLAAGKTDPPTRSHLDVLDQLSEMLARNIVFANVSAAETNCETSGGASLNNMCATNEQNTDCLS